MGIRHGFMRCLETKCSVGMAGKPQNTPGRGAARRLRGVLIFIRINNGL